MGFSGAPGSAEPDASECGYVALQELICPGRASISIFMDRGGRLRHEHRVRGKAKFVSRFKSESLVQSSVQKYFSSVFRNFMFSSRHPAPMKRDVSADRHEPWGGDAMDVVGA